MKRTTPAELLEAIADLMRGGAPMTGEIARMVIASFRRPAPAPVMGEAGLTPREDEILALLTQGYANKEIADRLSVSFDTVRTHLRHIYEKLHVRSRTEAAMKYMRTAETATAERAASWCLRREAGLQVGASTTPSSTHPLNNTVQKGFSIPGFSR